MIRELFQIIFIYEMRFTTIYRAETVIPENAEECVLLDMDPASDSRKCDHNQRGNVYDEDEPSMGGSRVQCASH